MKFSALAAVSLLACALAPKAHAQFGIKAGVNEAVLKGRVGEDATYKTYFHAGVFYEAKLIGPLSIQPELLYSLQGSQLKGATTVTNYTTQLNYIQVPILLKATLGPVFVEAGPQFGYLVAANENGTVQVRTASGNVAFRDMNQSSTGNYKRGEIAVCAGLGLKLGSLIRVGGRFVAGLNDVNNLQYLQGVNDPQLKNRVFQAYVAVQLPKL
ncbi:porin family protein [Hymenobacter sp. H14-R3]|uniref:porin family protein n=1 Tax=Hymenobacter sp. H14-R3 TaxID=3046308 RepID=UPI0024B9F649|nr:porin family protein [Hymenobacter sp. H14-R3]MDJ0366106.1 porin family protein [Hymenobacter sp. H14-R3]